MPVNYQKDDDTIIILSKLISNHINSLFYYKQYRNKPMECLKIKKLYVIKCTAIENGPRSSKLWELFFILSSCNYRNFRHNLLLFCLELNGLKLKLLSTCYNKMCKTCDCNLSQIQIQMGIFHKKHAWVKHRPRRHRIRGSQMFGQYTRFPLGLYHLEKLEITNIENKLKLLIQILLQISKLMKCFYGYVKAASVKGTYSELRQKHSKQINVPSIEFLRTTSPIFSSCWFQLAFTINNDNHNLACFKLSNSLTITLINCKLDYWNKNLFNLKRFVFVILLKFFQRYSRRLIVVAIHFSFADSALPRMYVLDIH